MFIHKTVAAAPDVPARRGRRARAAAARRDGAGADRDGADAGAAAAAPRLRLRAARRRSWTSGRRRRQGAGFELTPILKPLEPFRDSLVVVSNLARPESRFDTQPRGRVGVVARRRAARSGPRGRTSSVGTTIDQIVARADRAGHDVPVARSGDRGLHRPVGACAPGLQLRVREHAQLADADDAAADGNQPAGGLRADVRRAGHDGRAAGAHADRIAASSISSATTLPICKRDLGPRDRARLNEYLDDIREIERRIQRAEQQTAELTVAGCAGRRAGLVRRARRR